MDGAGIITGKRGEIGLRGGVETSNFGSCHVAILVLEIDSGSLPVKSIGIQNLLPVAHAVHAHTFHEHGLFLLGKSGVTIAPAGGLAGSSDALQRTGGVGGGAHAGYGGRRR